MLALTYLLDWLLDWIVRAARTFRRHRIVVRAKTWPQASGRVLSAETKSKPAFQSDLWSGEVRYDYAVDGKYYGGYASLPAEDEPHAEGLILAWKDRKIIVRYSPENPARSELLLEDQDQPATAG
jgi:hypothetical protein